jgi:hypothetical protein
VAQKDDKPKTDKKNNQRYLVWISLAIILIATALIRIRLLDVPLERDEGEYAYAGQLMLQGTPPYAQTYNMKLPGIYAAYALIILIFGQTHTAVHLGLLIINAATIVMIFLLAKRLFGPFAAIAAAAAFAMLSMGPTVQGIFANAEHFVILPAVAGILVLLIAIDSKQHLHLFASGLLLGLGSLMKQHGAMFMAFSAIYWFIAEIRSKPFNAKPFMLKGLTLTAGLALPFAITCLVLWQAGVFEKFWFWTVDYAREYVSAIPFSPGLKTLRLNTTIIISSAPLPWILSGIGLIALVIVKSHRKLIAFSLGLLVFSFLAICPGFYFRLHYFILLLPVVALLAGLGASFIFSLLTRDRSATIKIAIALVIAAAVTFDTISRQKDFFFKYSPYLLARTTYGTNPFPESIEIAKYIEQNSNPTDTIAVIGSEPQIYFYSKRRSATGHIYTYALMETHEYASKMQQEMIEEIEQARPKFLIYVHIFYSWLAHPDSDKTIFEWMREYALTNYEKTGVIDILMEEPTVYLWGDRSKTYQPQSKSVIEVYKLKKDTDN